MMIPCQRHLFDIPDEITYLNCAYFSPQLNEVRHAGYAGVNRKSHPWKVGSEAFFTESEQARDLFAQLIGANTDDVAIIPAVSYGIAVAAGLVDVKEGDEIVVLEDQFPSNYYPWLELARAKNARLVTLPRPRDWDWTAALLEHINRKSAVVALPNVHWTDGSFINLEKIAEKCRETGAELVLDVTQSLGALPISVKEMKPGFLVTAAYKWLLGPYSFGFLYVRPDLQNKIPLEHNWLNRKNSEDFGGLVNYRDEFQTGARRFDVGERSNFALMPMVVAALRQIHEWGVPQIQESLSYLTSLLAAQAKELGLTVTPSQKRAGHILGLRFPQGLPEGILQRLAEKNVFVSIRGSAMRVSPHLYNSEEDIMRLIKVLAETM
ncbi:aminotransferase class V-fold PLP-dependent enzyme [candidate division KSB1 bacterium]|nr:aminotransferase class V-fold PLP-dependent enzyme [candidate division KSB1 bacterium]